MARWRAIACKSWSHNWHSMRSGVALARSELTAIHQKSYSRINLFYATDYSYHPHWSELARIKHFLPLDICRRKRVRNTALPRDASGDADQAPPPRLRRLRNHSTSPRGCFFTHKHRFGSPDLSRKQFFSPVASFDRVASISCVCGQLVSPVDKSESGSEIHTFTQYTK